MTKGITVKRPFHKRRGRINPRQLRKGVSNSDNGARVPRVSRLMALAIRFDQLIQEGVVTDQADLARLGRVSRARLTQIMNLLNLAPDIQEELLRRQSSGQGRDPMSEKWLRIIVAEPSWVKQRRRWLSRRKQG